MTAAGLVVLAACTAPPAAKPAEAPRVSSAAASAATASTAAASVAPWPRAFEGLPPTLPSAQYVLLGEVHDNAIQHAQRAAVLKALLADGWPTVVVFEQMDPARDLAIKLQQEATPRDADKVAKAGGLDFKSWGWPLHKPVVQAALDGGAAIVGGGPAPALIRRVVREADAGVPQPIRPMLAAAPLGDAEQRSLEAEIDTGHCRVLPKDRWPVMALAQKVRDATMARAMLDAPPGARVVLIAGNGHVRRDWGVPHYLEGEGVPAEKIVSVGWLEGTAEKAGLYDAVRRTAAAKREDPCVAFKAMQRKR